MNSRKMLLYLMLGVIFSMVVSSVLYFGVYPATSKIVAGYASGRDLVITGDVRFIVDFAREYPSAVMLTSGSQVTFNSAVSTDPAETVDSAKWMDGRYYLDVIGEGRNSIHVIMEFYFANSTNGNRDVYAIRIVAKTTPNPDDRSWRLDSGGIDDPNGPANKVSAQVMNTDLIDGKAKIPARGITDVSYYGRLGYSVAISEENIALGQGSYFAWILGLNTASGERSEAIGEYILLLTVAHQQTLRIDNFRFEGNLWRPGFSSAEHLWAAIKDININYYS